MIWRILSLALTMYLGPQNALLTFDVHFRGTAWVLKSLTLSKR